MEVDLTLKEKEGIRYYQFPSLTEAGCLNAVFSRHGGVSPQPWASLNLGGTVGDDPERVIENRRRCFQAMGRSMESIFDVWQVHSADVVCTDQARPNRENYQKADIILTDKPEVTLFMRFADCVPILLYDPKKQVVGLVHAGWPGTVKKAVRVGVETMGQKYGCDPAEIYAGIGPSICVQHYPIGPDVSVQVQEAFGKDAESLLPVIDGQTHFDLWAANRLTLEQCGVRHIEISGLCTAQHVEDWFSHRGEKGRTGRFGAMIALPDGKNGIGCRG